MHFELRITQLSHHIEACSGAQIASSPRNSAKPENADEIEMYADLDIATELPLLQLLQLLIEAIEINPEQLR
ncbi:MAG: hypothetical protein C9356_09815 [Oleiphilus sp.]|nr:MAG: hypothetical protein C9356_09815 [Oleiphilus sp.]